MSKAVLALLLLAAGTGAGFVLAANREAPPPDTVTTHGEWVAIPNAAGDTVRAYVAYPERQGTAPAIIVIHEIFGLTEWEPTVADDYARKGYVAIAPDLLSSRYGSTRALGDSARQMMGTLVGDAVVADLEATLAWVRAQPATNAARVGAIGFCWGGGTVWRFVAAVPDLSAAVVCYGPAPDTTALGTVRTPVLGIYGEDDGRVNNQLPAVIRALAGAGTPFVADSYPGTGHGFLKPGRRGFGTDAAARAQADIDAFFTRHLEAP